MVALQGIPVRHAMKTPMDTDQGPGGGIPAEVTPAPETVDVPNPLIKLKDVELFYGPSRALKGITLDIPQRQVTAFNGPSGCGKSTLLRCLNRMNDLIEGVTIKGTIRIADLD